MPPGQQVPGGSWGRSPDVSVYQLNQEQAVDFNSARKLITVCQVMAIVSLFLGGVILSAAAVVVAFVARSKMQRVATQCNDEVRVAMMRSTIIPIGLCLLALALNVVSLVLFYPMIMEMLQSGGYEDLFSFGGSTSGASSGGSFWA